MSVREVIKLITITMSLAVVTDAVKVDLKLKPTECIDTTIHYVLEGDSLYLKAPDKFNLQHAWCKYYKGDGSLFKSHVKRGTGNILFKNVRKDTSTHTTWLCTLLRDRRPEDKPMPYQYADKNYTAFDCKVEISVMENYVNVTTNGKPLDAVSVSKSMLDYQYYVTYESHHVDGEIVGTSCDAKASGGLRMIYYDADSNRLFYVKDVYSINLKFRSLMKLNRGSSYLDCIFTLEGSNRPFLFRTYFIINQRETRLNSIIVLVNGLELVPRTAKISSTATAEYEYYYIIGEILTIDCRLKSDQGSTAKSKVDKFFSRVYNGSTVTEVCGPSENHVDITFKSELGPNNSERMTGISGLQPKNILYEYTSAKDEWTVHYQYTPNETLHLTCVTTAGAKNFHFYFIWDFRERKIDNHDYNNYTNSYSFTLGDADNGTSIKCLVKNKDKKNEILSSVIFKLHAVSPQVSHYATERGENTTQNDSTQISNVPENPGNTVWIIVGATLGTVVFVVGLCVPMVCRYMKSKTQSRYESTYYEYINEGDIQLPIIPPPQWNDYVEAGSDYTKIDEGQMVENNYYQSSPNVPNETQGNTEIQSPVASGSGAPRADYAVPMKNRQKGRKAMRDAEYVEPAYCSTPPAVDNKRFYTNKWS